LLPPDGFESSEAMREKNPPQSPFATRGCKKNRLFFPIAGVFIDYTAIKIVAKYG
jgi:hypothetical protein